MSGPGSMTHDRKRRSPWVPGLILAATMGASACGGGPPRVPAPRPLVVFSGARLLADSAMMQETHQWVTRADETIEMDPAFLISYETAPVPSFPWETFEYIGEDSVRVAFEASAPDAQTSYGIYAFLRLMHDMGRMDEWFPEAVDLEGYELERFIVARTGDSWLLGRAVFDTHPYAPLDQLVYAQDRGYLDAFLLTARGDEFPDARSEFEAEHPGRMEEYRAWFEETFGKAPPGAEDRGS